nr:DUF3750 domain-containing protein [Pseudaminobacter soli]
MRQTSVLRQMRLAFLLVLFVFLVFIMPAVAAIGWWAMQDRPSSWREADWKATGLLPDPKSDRGARIYILAARTGGLKGALSVHSWIVTKAVGADTYQRYDKVGWGSPVRHNAYPPDGRWYSNMPTIIGQVSGERAEKLLARVEAAIKSYPFSHPGDYKIWPGPNSNSFVAHVVAAVPELGARMPPNAAGRDYAPGWASLTWSRPGWDVHATLGGYLGFAVGAVSGLELHFMGLVAGVDLADPALKIPGFGRLSLSWEASADEGDAPDGLAY